LTWRFPLRFRDARQAALASCIIDGKAIACGDDGMASFERIRYRNTDGRFSPMNSRTLTSERFPHARVPSGGAGKIAAECDRIHSDIPV
jgi:hypothetical protein